ncbi:DedA family protein [Neobacillus terrae]|uniref:DedA family protein n=1 Tax=Neobacillus terrae TaxID=3034837 RepID=UPI0014083374|nr:DedA family protein [Neobacillus terrae]NHM32127.1 DedA family protein [Neobacillus terrae]
MSIDSLLNYIQNYGYFIIFLFLFFGIVGIPAPEESLLFFIGVLMIQNKLSIMMSLLSSVLGAIIGMLTAYFLGKYVGYPFINKYGKYIGITRERLEKMNVKYSKTGLKMILIGFYLPGLRQISPYFAGLAKIPFTRFLTLSALGALLWTIPYILAGYFLGSIFHINPTYVPYLGMVFLLIFLIFAVSKYIKKRSSRQSS